MIRIHLTADDIAQVRIASTPDFSNELVRAGHMLAGGVRTDRLTAWRQSLTRTSAPGVGKLFDLYSRSLLPGIFCQAVHTDPAATARAIAATAPDSVDGYLNTLSSTRAMTPFTRALAAGRQDAYVALGQAVANLQTAALDPYRDRISALTAGAAEQAGRHAAARGLGSLLRTLHPQIHWDGRVLSLDAYTDLDMELEGRVLVLRPSVLTFKASISGDSFEDSLEVSFPASEAPLLRDTRSRSQAGGLALSALLGTTRAAVLATIARCPAITTGQLAAQAGLSAASTSRQVTILRDSGLITTRRSGMSVHHHVTRLGSGLLEPELMAESAEWAEHVEHIGSVEHVEQLK